MIESYQQLILTFLSIIIIGILAKLLFNKTISKSSKDEVLLLGLSNSGKTSLFTKLNFNKHIPTVTSISENEALLIFPDSKKKVRIIDIPGHPKLQFKFHAHLARTKAIVFLVDSTCMYSNPKMIHSAAEYLFDVLIRFREGSILIVCNKSDELLCVGKEVLQKELESEINKIRKTHTAAVETQDDDVQEHFLGYENEDFRFVDLDNKSVEFIEYSCLVDAKKQDGEDLVMQFISNL